MAYYGERPEQSQVSSPESSSRRRHRSRSRKSWREWFRYESVLIDCLLGADFGAHEPGGSPAIGLPRARHRLPTVRCRGQMINRRAPGRGRSRGSRVGWTPSLSVIERMGHAMMDQWPRLHVAAGRCGGRPLGSRHRRHQRGAVRVGHRPGGDQGSTRLRDRADRRRREGAIPLRRDAVPRRSKAAGAFPDSRTAPIQAFLWGDYEAKSGTKYTYTIRARYGTPREMEIKRAATVQVTTENPTRGVHGVYFNRGVAGSDAYNRRFDEHRCFYLLEKYGRGAMDALHSPGSGPRRRGLELAVARPEGGAARIHRPG